MNKRLTEDKIAPSLILFSIPMIIGNMLQQVYNIVDTLIVGKTIGPRALSAVGSSYTLMVLLTSIILGLCIGSSVVFSHLYGAGKIEELKIGIFNSFVFVLCITCVITAGSYALLEQFLRWLHIPSESINETKEYLQVIFLGIPAVFLYNFFSAVLRSLGNTLVPLSILGISAITNIILDVIFIVDLRLGVAGAAWATVLAQVLSAVCIISYMLNREKHILPEKLHRRYHLQLLRLIISNATLTAIQQSIMNFGILMIQGLVNSFGFMTSAAFAAVVKIDAFAYMPAQDFGNAFSTFIAQNYGARKKERIHQGCRVAIRISTIFCMFSSIGVCLFAKPLMLVFVNESETEIINIGIQYLHIEGSCYIGIGLLFLLYGFYRGLGKAGMSIVLTVISLGMRVLLAYILSAIPSIGLVGIWWAIPIGWALADLVGLGWYYKKKYDLWNFTP